MTHICVGEFRNDTDVNLAGKPTLGCIMSRYFRESLAYSQIANKLSEFIHIKLNKFLIALICLCVHHSEVVDEIELDAKTSISLTLNTGQMV